MIKLLNTPNICSLSKNSMIFEVESTQFLKTQKVYPKLVLNFTDLPAPGYYFELAFINPKTLERELIRVDLVDVWSREGEVSSQYEVGMSINEALTYFVYYLNKIKKLISWYTLDVVENSIIITAKEAVSELIIRVYTESMSSGYFGFTFDTFEGFNHPIERDGYQMRALLFYNNPNNDLSNLDEFELINSQTVALDENARGLIDVSILLNDKIELEVFYCPTRRFKAIFPTLSGSWWTKASRAWAGLESNAHSTN
jgi:hypothetical protein